VLVDDVVEVVEVVVVEVELVVDVLLFDELLSLDEPPPPQPDSKRVLAILPISKVVAVEKRAVIISIHYSVNEIRYHIVGVYKYLTSRLIGFTKLYAVDVKQLICVKKCKYIRRGNGARITPGIILS
jgi:hypothetical protein